jgi:hypothetical protein
MLKTCLENLFVNMKSSFQKRHVHPNLLLFQGQILNDLRDSKDLLIVMINKNIGPAVIERDVYTKCVFTYHLLKTGTYQRIQPDNAQDEGRPVHPVLLPYPINQREGILAPLD